MKTDAISSHECRSIMLHLGIKGKWRAERLGATVEMARFRNEAGGVVHYSVTIARHLVVTARALTVADAVADVNEVIRAHELKPRALAGRRAGHHNCTGTPPLVRTVGRRAAESGGLWE